MNNQEVKIIKKIARKKYTGEVEDNKKRWATELKVNNLLQINGPCEVFIRRIDANRVDILFIMDREVMIKKFENQTV